MEKVLKESSVGIRVPATANLMVDSQDRNDLALNPWDFTINSKQNILTGFFNRIGATEVVFEWFEDNISTEYGNNKLTVDVSGTQYEAVLPNGIYTVEQALKALVVAIKDVSGMPISTWDVSANALGGAILTTGSAATFSIVDGILATQLGFDANEPAAVSQLSKVKFANLSPIRYIDIVSNSLTYNQELKDASTTATNTQDVLVRWYFAYDNAVATDGFGYPVLMGYEPFVLRRLYNPPKQIKWDKIQPIGQLNFELYARTSVDVLINGKDYLPLSQIIETPNERTNWELTLQVSEN